MRVGFVYNCATEEQLRDYPELALNLADSVETIDAVAEALEAGGHTVIRLNADRSLPARLADSSFDIAFNIATGFHGETRAAHVPAMFEYLQIPHTGPGPFSEAICHHKPTMKLTVLAHGLSTPAFQVFSQADEPLDPALRFPLIVKLPAEGGSLGLDYGSVVDSEAALRTRLELVLNEFHEGALVEEYIDRREFTVSVLGNDPPYALPIAELLFFGKKAIRLDEPDVSTFEQLQHVVGHEMTYVPMESRSVAPADIPADIAQRLQQTAIDAYKATGCLDWARIDLRMDAKGTVYILDVNLEPGIAPDYVMFKCAQAAGWTYPQMINRILDHAIERYPHLKGKQSRSVHVSHAERSS